jgi:glutamate formiminotransferase
VNWLVESVPNVSEGRRLDVVERLAEAVRTARGVHLLDQTSDASHNRSVFTMAGPAEAVVEALDRMIGVAIHEIDMDQHSGEHPRIGAVDVVPFIPLADTTMDECVELARSFGERIAQRYDLPVYLYAAAATRQERVKLADVRRGQYEGLKAAIDQHGREPDFGPARMHPSAGAVAVGARPFLIAYNINLATADVELAKRIARRVRESGGGLAKVQANGFSIDELGLAQVSMNLLDFSVTPIWRVWETVEAEAAQDGVELVESELIGLAPLAAFLDVADHAGAPRSDPRDDRLAASAAFLKLRDFSPLQALELRLAAAEAADVADAADAAGAVEAADVADAADAAGAAGASAVADRQAEATDRKAEATDRQAEAADRQADTSTRRPGA